MKRFKKFGKRFLAIALIAMSVFAVALPAAMAATYTIGAPAGKSGPATTRSQPNNTSVSYGTIGTDSTVDISNPTVTNGYVRKNITAKTGCLQARLPAHGRPRYCIPSWKPQRKTACIRTTSRVSPKQAARFDHERFGVFSTVERCVAGYLPRAVEGGRRGWQKGGLSS